MIQWLWMALVFVFGACVGSFLNVVIFRLPMGQSLVSPPSHDPETGEPLKAWENIPILSWLALRGRSRYTGKPISLQYPLVELVTGLLFAGLYAVYYGSAMSPAFLAAPPAQTWPALAVHLALVAGLIAATVIDTRLYIIPLSIPWTVAAIAVVIYPASLQVLGPGAVWVTPRVQGHGVGWVGGAALGLVVSIVLLWLKVLPQSFPMQPGEADEPTAASAVQHGAAEPAEPPRTRTLMTLAALALVVVAVLLGALGLSGAGSGGLTAAAVLVLWPVLVLIGLAYGPVLAAGDVAEEVFAYPHPRREVLKEVLFLLPPMLGAVLGYLVVPTPEAGFPPWVHALGGVGAGLLIGGGIVWLVRILGTLGFGKEAMGLGDVHLFAAVGAVIGVMGVSVAFFLAPFWGLVAVLLTTAAAAAAKGQARVIPYGPYLAGGALTMMVLRQPIEQYLLPLREAFQPLLDFLGIVY